MIKYNIKKLIAEKESAENRRITIAEISEKTGISKPTLYRMSSPTGDFSTRTRYVEKLCVYFQCNLNDIMEIIIDMPIDKKSSKNKDVK